MAAHKLSLPPTLTKTDILEGALLRQVERARQWLSEDSILMEPIHRVIGPQANRRKRGFRKGGRRK
jgi:hypothetical protein